MLTGEKAVWKYEYDLFNRLLKVSKNGQTVAEYIYDESGLRIKKTSPKGQVYYVFDTGGNVLYEQENRKYMEYIYVLGKHFARIDGNLDSGIEKKYFYHTDHLGSTVMVTDEAGKKVWDTEYTPFGKTAAVEGELKGNIKFTGKDLDEDTGLYYFNARWMDPELGRFITEDSVDDPNNPNLYVYVANNPLTNVDPTGHWNEDSKWYKPWTWFNKSDNNSSNSSSSSSNNSSSSSNNNNNTSNQGQNNQQQSDLDKLTEQAKEIQLKLDNLGKQIEELKELIRKLKANGMSKDEIRQEIVKWALKMVESGALYDNRFEPTLTRADCSGSVYFTFKSAGVNLKRDTAQGYYDLISGKNALIDKNDLAPGDVVTWYSPKPNENGDYWVHIQVYLGKVTDPITGKTINDAVLNAPGYVPNSNPKVGKPLYIISLQTYTGWMEAPKYNWKPAYGDLLKALGYYIN